AATQTEPNELDDRAPRIQSAERMSWRPGRLKDEGRADPSQISLAKWNNVRMALDIARECRDLLGGAGITLEYSAIRHALNVESVITCEGTETVHQLVISRQLTGQNAL